jgi:hypothetical protein
MNLKKAGMVLFIIFSLLPISKVLAQTTNAGFVPQNIWYSEDPFTEGDKIKIYTLIFNPDTRSFSGTVDFFDNSTLLGTKDFSIAATSAKDVYINWTVTAGDHEIFGQIENAKFLNSDSTYTNASITDNKTSTSSRTVASKIVAQNINNGINSVNGEFNSTVNSIQNIGNTAEKFVPKAAVQAGTTITNTLDGWRGNTSTTLQSAQLQTKNTLNTLSSSKNTTNTNAFQKPFTYVKWLVLTILAAIFKYKLLFYGILIVIIFWILRYIWSLIF